MNPTSADTDNVILASAKASTPPMKDGDLAKLPRDACKPQVARTRP
jgi:hypothetical protein